MKQREISQQVVFTAVLILFSIEFLTAGIIFWLDINPLIAIGTARGLEIASMILLLVRWGNGLESIGLSRNDFVPGLKKGFAWAAVFGLSAFLLLGVLYLAGYNIMNLFLPTEPKTAFSIFLLFLTGGLISPVAEEIFFRGIIYGWLRRWGAVTAIMGSTALFAMAHLLTSGVTAIQVIGGLVFAISYEMEKNLMVPITIHVLGNMAIFSLSILSAP